MYKLKENNNQSETFIGLDYGTSKIGVAIGRNNLVMPIDEIKNTNELSSVHHIIRIIYENKVKKIVVGLPVNVEGKDTIQARKVKKFCKLLKVISKKPIIFINEYHTTKDSLQEGFEKRLLNKRKNEDALAAALILKRYFNEIEEINK